MRLLVILLITFLSFSCSQQNILNGDPKISFDINNGHHSFTASGVKYPGSLTLDAIYMFTGYGNLSNSAQIFIMTDSLKTITYRLPQNSGSGLTINNDLYGNQQVGDYLDVTVTSFQNGFVNAVFSGKLSKAVTLNPLVFQQTTITNGEIKNVKIIY